MPRKPLTINQRIRRQASRARADLDEVAAILDELQEAKDTAEEMTQRSADEAISDLRDLHERLTSLAEHDLLSTQAQLDTLDALIGELEEAVPDLAPVQALVDAYDKVYEANETCAMHRDDPREYDTDEKQSAREELTEALGELADAFDEAEAVDVVAPAGEAAGDQGGPR